MHQGDPPGPDTSMDAARCTAGIRRGNRAAFLVLYEAQFERVLAMATAITGRDENYGLDVVQETFARVIRGIPVLHDWRAVDAWMARTTRSAAIDLLRRELRDERRRTRIAPPRSGDGPGLEDDRLAWLISKLRELDDESERLLRSHVIDGKSLAELADSGTSRDAVYGKIRRALASLKRAAMEAFTDD